MSLATGSHARAEVYVLRSGALGAGLVIFSRFPIIAATIHPYSLNGSPVDVAAGDWFVGKAAASILFAHPILGHVQVYNTHVRFTFCISFGTRTDGLHCLALCQRWRRRRRVS